MAEVGLQLPIVPKLNKLGMRRAEYTAESFTVLLRTIEAMSPLHSPELALAKTHLEIACFYAKKAVALQVENQL